MWPFNKPELSVEVLFDIHTYNKYGKETMNPDKFIATLTRKQIRMLNTFAADAHRSENLENELEVDLRKEYMKLFGEERKKDIERKLSSGFTDEDHIRTDEDYAAYLNNNRDKAMLTDEEEKRLKAMLFGFNKKEAEIKERLGKLEGESAKDGE